MLSAPSLLLSALLAVPATGSGPARGPLPVLRARIVLSSQAARGASRLFQVRAQRPFRLVLDQKSADFAIDVLDANRRVVRTVDAFGWGEETATFGGGPSIPFVRVRRVDDERPLASFSLKLVALADLGTPDATEEKAEDAGTKARLLAHEKSARPEDVVAAARTAANLWHDTANRSAYLRASLELADTLNSSIGAFDEALPIYGSALELSRDLADARSEAECLNNRGVLFRRQASYQAALDDLDAALIVWRKLPIQTPYAASLNNIALAETDLGDYQKALGHYAEARALFERLGDDAGRAFVDSNQGLIQGRLGDAEASVRSFERAAAAFKSAGNALAAGRALTNSSRMYLQLGNVVRAGRNVRSGMALIARVHDDRAMSEGYSLFGDVLVAEKQPGKALDSFQSALGIARATGDRVAQANALMKLGLTSIAMRERAEGISFLESSRDLFEKIGNPASKASVLQALALAYRDEGELVRAQEFSQAAVALIERLRGTVAEEELRVSLLSSTHEYYFTLIDILMRQGKTAEALQAAERSRARALLDSIEGGKRSREEQEMVMKLNVAISKLARDSPGAEAARGKAEALSDELARLRTGNSSTAAAAIPDSAEVQRSLAANQTLIEYALGDSAGYIWRVTADSISSFSMPGSRTIRDRSRQVATLLSSTHPSGTQPKSDNAELKGALAGLSRALMIPSVTMGLPLGEHLLIVPDGAVESVPFECLPAPGATALIDRYEIVEAPSVAVTFAIEQRQSDRLRPARNRAAVIADPVFDVSDTRLGKRASSRPETPRFARLAFSRREALAIRSTWPADSVVAFLDFDASRDLFTSGKLDDFTIIHVSTHGITSEGRAEDPGLVFSLVDRNGSPAPGILSVQDVLSLDLRADLVVLSACDSALGREFAGEGAESLARAFLHAGASLVLASRWQIDDEASYALLSRFYRSIRKDGLSPAAALREAQSSIRRDPRWQSPFFWASFFLQGESR